MTLNSATDYIYNTITRLDNRDKGWEVTAHDNLLASEKLGHLFCQVHFKNPTTWYNSWHTVGIQ